MIIWVCCLSFLVWVLFAVKDNNKINLCPVWNWIWPSWSIGRSEPNSFLFGIYCLHLPVSVFDNAHFMLSLLISCWFWCGVWNMTCFHLVFFIMTNIWHSWMFVWIGQSCFVSVGATAGSNPQESDHGGVLPWTWCVWSQWPVSAGWSKCLLLNFRPPYFSVFLPWARDVS